jgi:hypothetical protein
MKQILLFAVVLICMTACSNKGTDNAEQTAKEAKTYANETKVYKLDDLLKVAEDQLNQTVTVRGFVTHTCKHSGKRCFIAGDDPKVTMRVEAKGEIGGFNRELTGSELAITGILKERRLTKEFIDQHEESVKEKEAEEDGSAESCAAELNNIKEMREWMKAHNKDYYSIYYMDGESYEILE